MNVKMHKNESDMDRVVRLVLAVAAVAGGAALGFGSVAGVVLLVLAVVLVATAAVGFCPLYRLLGLSTAKSVKR